MLKRSFGKASRTSRRVGILDAPAPERERLFAVGREAMARVELPELAQVEPRDVARPVRTAIDLVVVCDHQDAVPGELDVNLQHVGPMEPDRLLEGDHRVLGRDAGAPAMGDVQGGREPFKKRVGGSHYFPWKLGLRFSL